VDAVGKAGLWTLIVAAVGVWFLLAPEQGDPALFTASAQDYASLIETALSDYDANNALTDSAPQQQVVNGWVARDLLSIVAYQNVDLLESLAALGDQGERANVPAPPDERIPALLVLATVAVCWVGMNLPKSPTTVAFQPEVTP
jgi:hypothetical protein